MAPQLIAAEIARHFDPTKSHIAGFDPDAALRSLGIDLAPQELIQLAGAPVESEITMQEVAASVEPPGPFDPPAKVEQVPAGLRLTITNDRYINGKNQVVLFNEGGAADPKGIYIKLIRFHPRSLRSHIPKGIGALMLKSMLDGARSLPNMPVSFSRMSMLAAGGRNWGKIDDSGERWIGYLIWPRYGFDRPLLSKTKRMFPFFQHHPENLAPCSQVTDVLNLTDGGPEFWHIVGDGWYMDFNMAPSSASEAQLSAYLGGL